MIPIITKNTLFFSQLSGLISKEERVCNLHKFEEVVDYLKLDLPSLFILDCCGDFPVDDLIEEILLDPWLIHGGVIAICKDSGSVQKIEEIKGLNLIVALHVETCMVHLSKVLSVVKHNKRILFQREFESELIKYISASYKLENDPIEVQCYANLICNFLANAGKINPQQRMKLNLALNEMLLNAIEHGNCEITYDDKTEWLEAGKDIAELISLRNDRPHIAQRKVVFDYAINEEGATFSITDEGDGFDWRAVENPLDNINLLQLHGRGILMSKNSVEQLEYNEKGNKVTFKISYDQDWIAEPPRLFGQLAGRSVDKGEVVLTEHEESDFLYYIVKGEFDVVVNDRTISKLTPEDIFIGEMSFLLNNKRSATVVASKKGKIIKISKKEFVNAIRENPHYALLLSKLLAQRIARINQQRS